MKYLAVDFGEKRVGLAACDAGQSVVSPLGRIAAVYDLEPAFDRLAAVVRKSLKMDEIYKMMGL